MPRVAGKNGEKTDFSDEISEKQKIILTHLGRIGWSISTFSGNYCNDLNNYDIDDKDYNNCKEKIKKQITSICKSRKILGELEKYISYIENTEEFEKTNQFKLRSVSDHMLDNDLRNKLKSISINIEKQLINKI